MIWAKMFNYNLQIKSVDIKECRKALANKEKYTEENK
jgi:hypothetical protein